MSAEIKKFEAEALLLDAKRRQIELQNAALEREQADINSSAYEHNVYSFFGSVDAGTALTCIQTLAKWSRREPGCDLTIVFNSPGGSVIHGLALYDHLIDLRQQGHRITTVTRGMAASMGGILLQAGDERIVGPNAHVLIHEVSSVAIGKFSEIEDEIAFTKRLQERLVNILAERSTLTASQIKRRWKKTDWWLGSDETVKLGFADRIG